MTSEKSSLRSHGLRPTIQMWCQVRCSIREKILSKIPSEYIVVGGIIVVVLIYALAAYYGVKALQ
jgi:hypothetical protein